MRRFYRTAVAVPAEDGWAVHLDGRPVRTPARRPLTLPGEPLAAAIAGEWEGQGTEVDPRSMPLTRLACTATDRIAGNPEPVVAELVRYAETDLLCYRTDHPQALAERQQAVWQPLLDWALMRFDARLETVTGIMPTPQPPAPVNALREAVVGLDPLSLSALHAAAAAAGSLVVGLALLEGEIDATGAFEAGQLEETWQIEQWGEDSELTGRREGIRRGLEDAERFMRLAR